MSKDFDVSAIEPITESFTPSQGSTLQPTPDFSSEEEAPSHATAYEGGTNSHPVLWRPTEPQFTKAISEYYL